MVLGMSLSAFTALHVVISLIGIVTGFVWLFAAANARSVPGWAAAFLLTTVATSVTGFLFPQSQDRTARHFWRHIVGRADAGRAGSISLSAGRALALDQYRRGCFCALPQFSRRGRPGLPEADLSERARADAIRATIPGGSRNRADDRRGPYSRRPKALPPRERPFNVRSNVEPVMIAFPSWARYLCGPNASSHDGTAYDQAPAQTECSVRKTLFWPKRLP